MSSPSTCGSERFWLMPPPSRPAARTVDRARQAGSEMARTFVLGGTPADAVRQVEPLWKVANSLCPHAPPVAGNERRAYDQPIGEVFYR